MTDYWPISILTILILLPPTFGLHIGFQECIKSLYSNTNSSKLLKAFEEIQKAIDSKIINPCEKKANEFPEFIGVPYLNVTSEIKMEMESDCSFKLSFTHDDFTFYDIPAVLECIANGDDGKLAKAYLMLDDIYACTPCEIKYDFIHVVEYGDRDGKKVFADHTLVKKNILKETYTEKNLNIMRNWYVTEAEAEEQTNICDTILREQTIPAKQTMFEPLFGKIQVEDAVLKLDEHETVKIPGYLTCEFRNTSDDELKLKYYVATYSKEEWIKISGYKRSLKRQKLFALQKNLLHSHLIEV